MDSQKKIVLIVDDNAAARKTLELMVQSLGFRTETAENGKMALCHLANVTVDCVIMDLDMPVMDGYSASEFIRQKLQLTSKDLPIIAITALLDQDLAGACSDFEINCWAQKPVDRSQMRVLLQQAGLEPT